MAEIVLALLAAVALSATPAAPAADPATAAGPPEATAPQLKETLTVNETPLLVPETNTVAAKLPLPNQLTPASVSVVAAPLLERQDARVLGEALRNVSGLSIHSESGVADFFLLRGFDSESSGLVLTDGTPEPEVARYTLYNADRVEVLKGPASFLYGGNPLAGAVNLVRKQPLPYDFAQVDGSAGSFGTHQGKVDANWSGADDGLGLRINGLWEETDGWRDGKSGRALAVNPVFTLRPGERSTFTLSYELARDDFHPDAGLPLLGGVGGRVAGVPARRSYQSPFDFSHQDLARVHFDWEGKWDRFTLRNKAYFNSLDWRSDGTLLPGVFPGATGRLEVQRILTLLDDSQAFWGDQIEGVFSFSTGAVEHRLLTGVELARRNDNFTLDVGFLPALDLFAPVETATQPVPLLPGQSQRGDTRTTILSPYVLDSIGLGKGFTLLFGGRYDHSDFADDVSGTRRTDSRFSPLLGAVYAPSPQLSIYANAGRGFAPPSSRVVGPRRPETGTQVEAGVKGDFLGGRLRASLAVYRIERESEPIPGANGFTVQNGSERSRGIELEVAGEPLPRLFALFSYAYDDATFTRFDELALVGLFPPTFALLDRAGNTLPLAPAHLANLWLTHRLPGGVELSLGGRYVSRQFIAADNAFAIPAALTADAALSYQVGPWRAHLNAKNLTGKKTYTRGFGSTSVLPAPGFALYAGVEVRWASPAASAAK